MKRERSPSLEREIRTSYKRICDIKRQDNGLDQQIKKINDKIHQLSKERDDILGKRAALLDRDLQDAIIPYSRSWVLQFVTKMRLCLPQELRDKVYTDLCHPDSRSSKESENMEKIMFGYVKCPGRPCECLRHVSVPHFLDPAYVGPEVAFEIVETLYRDESLPPKYSPLCSENVQDINYLLFNDGFHVGFRPFQAARRFRVFCQVDKYTIPGTSNINRDMLRGFEALLEIVDKKDFQLRIILVQRRIRLNILAQWLDILKPVFHVFEREGADIEILWEYKFEQGQVTMNSLVTAPFKDWREGMIMFLNDNSDKIRSEHMEYKVENDEDYDPHDYSDSEPDSDSELSDNLSPYDPYEEVSSDDERMWLDEDDYPFW